MKTSCVKIMFLTVLNERKNLNHSALFNYMLLKKILIIQEKNININFNIAPFICTCKKL